MNEWNEEGRGKRHGTSTLSRERSGSKEVIRSPLCCRKTEKKTSKNHKADIKLNENNSLGIIGVGTIRISDFLVHR